MRVLTCDSSLRPARFGIYQSDQQWIEAEAAPLTENFPETIEALLTKASVQLNEIDLFAVVIGPGSFTGLRVGLSAMKIYARVFDKPIVGVSSLEAMALSHAAKIKTNLRAVSVIDAATQEYYVASFELKQGTIARLSEDDLVDETRLAKEMARADIAICDKESTVTRLAPFAIDTTIVSISAMAIAAIGRNEFKAKRILASSAQPHYLKLSAAEKRMGQAQYE